MSDIYTARKRLTQIHNELRNRGLNPIEALDELSERLGELASLDGRLRFVGQPADLVSLVYQEVLAPNARNGLGQYLTPLPVADMIAQVVCELGEAGDIIDPFCGVGVLLERVAVHMPKARLLGIEISEPVARMAQALSELGGTPISLELRDAFTGLADGSLPSADVVVTNPPFGAAVTSASIEACNIPKSLRALAKLPAELLGLEVSIRCLRIGGILAIVLPQSILTNRRWDAYRADALSRLSMHAAVSLPDETFGPFKGVANACVLFATRRDGQACQTFPMHVSESVGYSSTGRQGEASDLGDIARNVALGEGSQRHVTVLENGQALIGPADMMGDDGVRLGDVAEVFVGKNPSRAQYTPDGPWLLKVGDLAGSVVPWRTRPNNRVSEAWFKKQSRVHLRVGDICLTAAGHRPKYVGLKVDLVDHVPPEGAAPSGEVMAIRLRPETRIEPEQLLFFLRSGRGYRSIQDLVRGSSGHLYADDLSRMRLPELQHRCPEEAVAAFRKAVEHYRKYRLFEIRSLEAARERERTS